MCQQGFGSKPALIHERFSNEIRKYSFNDLRMYSNNASSLLVRMGLESGDRISLFMDRIPHLYISFFGILKMGGVAQPLFSAFGEDALLMRLDDARTRAVLTTPKYLGRLRHMCAAATWRAASYELTNRVKSCVRDGGRPSGIGLQGQISNHLERHRSKALVVSVRAKRRVECVR